MPMATATPTTVALLASARAGSSGRVLSTCSGCVLCMGESPSSSKPPLCTSVHRDSQCCDGARGASGRLGLGLGLGLRVKG